jgi:hypothetical protein
MPIEEFRNTPVSELMSTYGEAEGPANCPGDFGNDLVTRWRSTRREVCHPYPGSDNGGSGGDRSQISSSSISTYLHHQTRHHGNGDNLIHFKDVSVNLGLFADKQAMYDVVRKYVATRHFQQPYVPFKTGFVQGKCSVDRQAGWDAAKMPGWNKEWTTDAFEPVASDGDAHCDEWIDHPVLVLQRDTFANFFHDSEDMVNAFLALAVLGWKLGDTQLMMTDLYPEGPFWEIWKQAFSQGGPSKPAMTAWDIKNAYGDAPGKKGVNHRVCFRDLAVGIYGPAAPITVASWNTPCKNTGLMKAYADFVIRGMGLESFTHYAEKAPSRTVTITYVFCSIVFPSFLVSSRSITACLHSSIPHDTSLTIIPPLNPSSIDTILTLLITIQVHVAQSIHCLAREEILLGY